MIARGTLFLIVGASGVGKDSLIDGVRARLAKDPRFIFPQRIITRPADAGGEAHRAVDRAEFAALRQAGAFALSWDANDLSYAIPAAIEDDLAGGRHVVANVSRLIVPEARLRYRPLQVICVTADAEVIARRLAARGRESVEEIAARLKRGALALPSGPDVTVLSNDRDLPAGIDAMFAVLTAPAA